VARAKEAVTWSAENGLATLRIAREHGNAINDALLGGLSAACRELDADPAVRGILLTAGGKIFCPGLDLQELVVYDRRAMARFMAEFGACILRLYTLGKPMVAAMSGHALAGGCILGLTADWRILKRGAMVGLNEVRVGVPLPFGVAQILRGAVNPSRLDEVAVLGRNYSGEDAVATGLVHELHEETGFADHGRARLEEYVAKDLRAFATTKRYMRSSIVERIREKDQLLMSEFLDCWFSPETRDRIEEIVADLKARGK